MKLVELPDDIADILQNIPAQKRSEFLVQHGFKMPILENKNFEKVQKKIVYQLFSDGASRGNPGEAGAGFVLFDSEKNIVYEGREYLGRVTNNVAEWMALLLGLKKARELSISSLQCFLDSELVVKQVNREYRVKHPDLIPLHEELQKIFSEFTQISCTHVYRKYNQYADRLSNEAIDQNKEKLFTN